MDALPPIARTIDFGESRRGGLPFSIACPGVDQAGSLRSPSAPSLDANYHRGSPEEYYFMMQITTGTVIGGKVVIEGAPLAEGSIVTVLSREPEEAFTLSPEDEDELLAAMAEIEKGEFVSADELLSTLRKHG